MNQALTSLIAALAFAYVAHEAVGVAGRFVDGIYAAQACPSNTELAAQGWVFEGREVAERIRAEKRKVRQ